MKKDEVIEDIKVEDLEVLEEEVIENENVSLTELLNSPNLDKIITKKIDEKVKLSLEVQEDETEPPEEEESDKGIGMLPVIAFCVLGAVTAYTIYTKTKPLDSDSGQGVQNEY